jgi:hypothetical protein
MDQNPEPIYENDDVSEFYEVLEVKENHKDFTIKIRNVIKCLDILP